MHYKLTENTKVVDDITLYQIQATQDCLHAKKGDFGGWIQSTNNLTGNAWVYGNAKVYGNALVCSGTWLVCPLQIQGTRHFFNVSSPSTIKIGCLKMTFDDAINNYEEIGVNNGYTKEEIAEYKRYIDLAIAMYANHDRKQ